jgi:hypothetical protein
MKNIILFYVALILPMAALGIATKLHYINSTTFVIGLFAYCFVYHPFISGLRLVSKGIIDRKNLWNYFIPWGSGKYFKALYLP